MKPHISDTVCTHRQERKEVSGNLPTLAIRRVLKLEKKNRVLSNYYIERELKDIMSGNNLSHNDFTNLALQNFINLHGMPVLLLSIQHDQTSIHQVSNGDVLNLALTELLKEKGYI
jgi:hypothetical protein